MTFRHVPSEWQPSVITKILELAEQAANHRVTPERIIEFVRGRAEELRTISVSDRAYDAARERLELAEAVVRFQRLKRELRVIDFGDQITLALQIVEEHPQVARDYRTRFAAALLDEYQDTNVAQADLIAGLFGGGLPRHGRRRPRPEHLCLAGGEPVQPHAVRRDVPALGRATGRAPAAARRTSGRGRASCTPPTRSSARSRPSSGPTRTRS